MHPRTGRFRSVANPAIGRINEGERSFENDASCFSALCGIVDRVCAVRWQVEEHALEPLYQDTFCTPVMQIGARSRECYHIRHTTFSGTSCART